MLTDSRTSLVLLDHLDRCMVFHTGLVVIFSKLTFFFTAKIHSLQSQTIHVIFNLSWKIFLQSKMLFLAIKGNCLI